MPNSGVLWLQPRVVVETTVWEFVNGCLRDPVLRQVVAAASGKRQAASHLAAGRDHRFPSSAVATSWNY